jgi:hypothetical protein
LVKMKRNLSSHMQRSSIFHLYCYWLMQFLKLVKLFMNTFRCIQRYITFCGLLLLCFY